MKTNLACLPCFRRQAQYAASLATEYDSVRAEILVQTESHLASLSMEESPPVNSIGLYRTISMISNNPDPFCHLKQQSNKLALEIRPHVEALIKQGNDPLYRAILFAIAGNIIDYGSQQEFDLNGTLTHCLQKHPAINHYEKLRNDLTHARHILYLADNCGEIVFDSLVAEQLTGAVTFVVKNDPIINDATTADAIRCGLDRRHRIISNGTACPGTPLKLCTKEVQKLFLEADIVISKGQGNLETLSEETRPVYHLLTVKCPVVARHIEEISNHCHPISTGAAVLLRLGSDDFQ